MISTSPSSRVIGGTWAAAAAAEALREMAASVAFAASTESTSEQRMGGIASSIPTSNPLVAEIFSQIDEWENEGGRQKEIKQAFRRLAKLPVSLDLIFHLVRRGENPISLEERMLMMRLKRELPDLNRALLSYELLQRETDRMDLARFDKTELRIGEEVFEVHDTTGADYRFLIFAADSRKGTIGEIVKQKIESGVLCASLIADGCSDFFCQKEKYAMVLSADARNIVATTREDAHTPFVPNDPKTKKFYWFYQRLQLLSGVVERLCREAGKPPLGDNLSKLNRLRSLQIQGSADPEIERLAKEAEKSILADPTLPRHFDVIYQTIGLTRMKANEALRALSEASDQENLAAQLRKCLEELEKIQGDEWIFHNHIHPIQSAGDLLAQTPYQSSHQWNEYGLRFFNEVNLDLETRYQKDKAPIAVRAILIDKGGFDLDPTKFLPVLLDARVNGIPILLRKDPVLRPEEVRTYLMNAIMEQDKLKIQQGLSKPGINEEMVAECLMQAIQDEANHSICELLLKKGVSESSLVLALQVAAQKNIKPLIDLLFSYRPALCEAVDQWAFDYAASDPDEISRDLAFFLLKKGYRFSDRQAQNLLFRVVRKQDYPLLDQLYTACKNQIPERELHNAIDSLITSQWSRIKPYLPPEEASRALRYAMDHRDVNAIRAILLADRLIPSLSPQEVEAGFLVVVERGSLDDLESVSEKHPDLISRAFVYAASHPDEIPYGLAVFLLRKGYRFSDRQAQNLLSRVVLKRDYPLLDQLYTACKNQIPEKELHNAIDSLITSKWGLIELYLPREEAPRALRYAMDRRDVNAIRAILLADRLIPSLSPQEVEAGFLVVVERGSQYDLMSIKEKHPRLDETLLRQPTPHHPHTTPPSPVIPERRSLSNLALSAIRTPFHLASWAVYSALSMCRRKVKRL